VGGPRENGEPEIVVGVIDARWVLVEAVAIKERAVEQVVGHAALLSAVNVRGVAGRPEPHAQVLVNARQALDADTAIARNQNRHFLAVRLQSGREGADHIGQSSGLCERVRLGCHH
jgi:hypothetical protein